MLDGGVVFCFCPFLNWCMFGRGGRRKDNKTKSPFLTWCMFGVGGGEEAPPQFLAYQQSPILALSSFHYKLPHSAKTPSYSLYTLCTLYTYLMCSFEGKLASH